MHKQELHKSLVLFRISRKLHGKQVTGFDFHAFPGMYEYRCTYVLRRKHQ